ncbi:hypothetical protein ACFVU2_19095 [Leifsonia sp. NPDC058194]|uniref:hypothetical protein n=1 Tax=Leifsonia sp. NPDC058194 TaxID=3346374 RepID=UPI0036D93885
MNEEIKHDDVVPKTTPCPSDSSAVRDEDGWCSKHGWDCADFRMFLADEDR